MLIAQKFFLTAESGVEEIGFVVYLCIDSQRGGYSRFSV